MKFLSAKIILTRSVKQFGDFDGFIAKKISHDAFFFNCTNNFGLFKKIRSERKTMRYDQSI